MIGQEVPDSAAVVRSSVPLTDLADEMQAASLRDVLDGALTITGPITDCLTTACLLMGVTDAEPPAEMLAQGFPEALTDAQEEQMLWVAYWLCRIPAAKRQQLVVSLLDEDHPPPPALGDLLSAIGDWVTGTHAADRQEM